MAVAAIVAPNCGQLHPSTTRRAAAMTARKKNVLRSQASPLKPGRHLHNPVARSHRPCRCTHDVSTGPCTGTQRPGVGSQHHAAAERARPQPHTTTATHTHTHHRHHTRDTATTHAHCWNTPLRHGRCLQRWRSQTKPRRTGTLLLARPATTWLVTHKHTHAHARASPHEYEKENNQHAVSRGRTQRAVRASVTLVARARCGTRVAFTTATAMVGALFRTGGVQHTHNRQEKHSTHTHPCLQATRCSALASLRTLKDHHACRC